MDVSVIIPVLHEEGLINLTIDHLRSQESGADQEIIVVDGSEEADTLLVIRDRTIKCLGAEKGRAQQMNEGAAAAAGDILLFLHVDTELPERAFPTMASIMKNSSIVGGAFDLSIDQPGMFFRLIEKVACLRSRITRIPYGDQAIFVRRDYFVSVGGFKPVPLMEDVDLMMRIRRRGDRIFITREKVKTSARRWAEEGAIRCTLRNWAVMLLYLTGVPPHKLVRWYPPVS